jgi:lysophospholipase L1-like esterase
MKLESIKKHLLSGKRFKIVFLGDSITSTEWVHPNWREIVEYVLKEELIKILDVKDWNVSSWGIRCINSGLDGATTQDILDHLETDVFAYQPSMVICMIGTNDRYFNINPQQHRKNVQMLIKAVSSKVEHFIFSTSIPANHQATNKEFAKYFEMIKPLFPCPGVKFIDLFKIYQKYDLNKFFAFVSGGNEVVGMKSGDIDYLHPNQLGNAYIAKVFLKEIFGIDFDPELYLKSSKNGLMYPKY